MSQTPQKTRAQLVLDREIQEFLIDREAQRLARKTLEWYAYSLHPLGEFMAAEGITEAKEITPGLLRRYIIHLSDSGHNDHGVAGLFSAAKAFLSWYEDEYNPKDWSNPAKRVKSPKRPTELKQPISAENFRALAATCKGDSFTDARDQAMLFLLVDSGVRRQELADLKIGDVNMSTGTVLVRSGKGGKTRQTFVGARTRKALAKYYRFRPGASDKEPLWTNQEGRKLTLPALREVLRRRSKRAGIPEASFHDFRRAFAVNALRSGMDLITLQRMMGHADLSVLNRYLALVGEDLREAHNKHGPLDYVMDS